LKQKKKSAGESAEDSAKSQRKVINNSLRLKLLSTIMLKVIVSTIIPKNILVTSARVASLRRFRFPSLVSRKLSRFAEAKDYIGKAKTYGIPEQNVARYVQVGLILQFRSVSFMQ
jgi:hypothetical protein